MIPAFPRPFSADDIDPDISYPAHVGMDLRDYFAAKVMQGICASGPSREWTNRRLAVEAYELADAMMEARNAK